jgi:hypothetical protein
MIPRVCIAIVPLLAGCGSAGTPQASSAERRSQLVSQQFNAADETLTPYMETLRYPDNWPDISQRRDSSR